MTPTISSLLSRVRAASGPDSDLDIDIGIALAGWRHGRVTLDPFSFTEDPDGDMVHGENTFWIADGGIQPLSFTESIDAAVALVERVLPGCHRWYTLSLVIDNGTSTFCIANREHGPDIEPFYVTEGHEASAPLAILAALLSALDQKDRQ